MNPLPLWSRWAAIQTQVAAAARVVLFLDYDGTLVPLADHPSQAILPSSLRRLLKQLASSAGVSVVIVSGRSLRELQRLVRLAQVAYVGNHGLELSDATLQHVHPSAHIHRALLKHLAIMLRRALKTIPGVWVEDKGLSLSVHYRNLDPRDALLVKNTFYSVLRPYQTARQIRVTLGQCVFEVRPPVRWNKGTAVGWLLARCEAKAPEVSVLPVYIGDDMTDEDAFEVLARRGVTVAVGPSNPLTKAQHSLQSPADVHQLLQRMLEARSHRNGS